MTFELLDMGEGRYAPGVKPIWESGLSVAKTKEAATTPARLRRDHRGGSAQPAYDRSLLLQALISEDMYLAGSFIMMLSVLTVIGTLLSDLLLAWLDPRIRHT